MDQADLIAASLTFDTIPKCISCSQYIIELNIKYFNIIVGKTFYRKMYYNGSNWVFDPVSKLTNMIDIKITCPLCKSIIPLSLLHYYTGIHWQ